MIHTGYIGLGNIGKPMCANLIKNASAAGLAVTVYDVMPDPVAEMVALGARAASSVADIAASCELIGVCVRDDNDVDSLLYGEGGLLALAAPGTIIAVHSTVTKNNTLRWAKDGAEKNIHIIDAPITGGAQGAADGTLCIMVGGPDDVLQRAQAMFACTSKKVVHGGDVGAGIALKLANNLINYAGFTAISEGVALVKHFGLNPEHLYAVGQANGVITPMMQQFISGREGLLAGCSAEEMESIFGPFAGLAEKDLDHALNLADELKVALEATRQVRKGIRNTFLKGVSAQ
mgnify:CR=1 FL=1